MREMGEGPITDSIVKLGKRESLLCLEQRISVLAERPILLVHGQIADSYALQCSGHREPHKMGVDSMRKLVGWTCVGSSEDSMGRIILGATRRFVKSEDIAIDVVLGQGDFLESATR